MATVSLLTQDVAERDAQVEVLAQENQKSLELLNDIRRDLITCATTQPSKLQLIPETFESMEITEIVAQAKYSFETMVRQYDEVLQGEFTTVHQVSRLERTGLDLSETETLRARSQALEAQLQRQTAQSLAGEERFRQQQSRLAELEMQMVETARTQKELGDGSGPELPRWNQEDLERLQMALQQCEHECEVYSEEMERLKQLVADLEAQLQAKELDQAQGRSTLDGTSALQLQLVEAKDNLQAERESNGRLQEEIRMLRTRLEEEDQHLRTAARHEGQLQTNATHIMRLEQKVVELQSALREKDVSVSALEAQVEGLRRVLREREHALERVQSDVVHEFESVTGTLQTKVEQVCLPPLPTPTTLLHPPPRVGPRGDHV